jgi:hypothetical protein
MNGSNISVDQISIDFDYESEGEQKNTRKTNFSNYNTDNFKRNL